MEFANFYSDPPHQPQLFCCSLLHTLQLQSPPPAMSSSSALFFPRSRGVAPNVDDSATVVSASAGSRRATGLAESEFAFLESKPSLLDERVARGKAAGGNGKGRRHAGEAILRRKLANQAFLVKVGSGGGGKELGGGKSGGGRGRRNQRVLSELVADQFAPSVPYSLNRKSRWAQEGADWLTELAGGWSDGPKLRLSLAEADYSLVGTESVRALHRLEMADKGSGRNESRWAKSGRGALLADLARSEEEEVAEERENEEPSEELHFQLTRPNPVSRLFAGKFFKRKQIRYNKRSGGMELSAGAGGAPMPTNRPPVTESEPEEENEFLAQYRPRRETYSLADFVKDSSPQSQNQQHSSMVIVRRKNANNNNKNSNKSAGGAHLKQQDDLNSFAIIPELECIPLPDSPIDFPPNDSPLSSNPSSTDECPKQQQCPNALSQLRQQLLNAKNGGFFRQFPLALAISGTAQINELAAQQADWHPQWLGTDLLALDLSWTLAKEPETQMLILVLSPGELLVNSLIQLNEQKVAQALDGAENGLEQKIRSLLDAVRSDFAEWELSHQHQRTASTHEHLRATFHSPRMSLALQPLSIQAILAHQRAELGREEENQRQQFVGAEELLGTGTKLTGELLDDEEEEEFELIDMDELLGGTVKRGNATNSPMVSTPKCADCSSTKSNAPLAMVPGCGHRCCRECLGNAIEQRQSGGVINLNCPICPSQLPLDLLPWVLPLPAVNALILLREAELAIQAGHQLAQCPCCQGILDAGGNDGNLRQFVTEFGQISCNRCALHWCPKCEQASHWPMDCAQNGEWERRIRPNEGTQQQQINGQFAEICTESRTRRLDARLGWQLGKHMRRLGDSRTERRFLLARKTALHLLEFGTAWLYLNRQPRPVTWNQLKSLLWAIRERVECLDNELLFSGSLTDAETIKAKLADLEQLGEKGLAKFSAALANKGSSGDGIQQ